MKIKWFCMIVIMSIFFGGCSSPVFASSSTLLAIDSTDIGSVEIYLEDTEQNLSKQGVVFGIVKAADVVNGEFVCEDSFQTLDLDLNSLQTANELAEAAEKFMGLVDTADKTAVSDENGVVCFENLSVGVYLIYAIECTEYETIEPFLISIPTWNQENGSMEYDLIVYPKHASMPEPIAAKTGDATPILTLSLVMTVSVLCIIFLYIRYRKC